MKRILPAERILCGFLLLVLLMFFLFVLLPINITFGKESVFIIFFIIIPFIVGFSISINLIISHLAFDSEKLVFYSLFKIKKIELNNITQITRNWEGSSKSLRLKYYVHHIDEHNNKEVKTRIYLPENYEAENVQEFLKCIKKKNDNFVFQVGI